MGLSLRSAGVGAGPLLLALFAPACDPSTVDSGTESPALMEPERLAARIKLDLLGERPTDAELSAVETAADPYAEIDTLTERWLADEGFEALLVSRFADQYRTRADHYVVGADGDAQFLDETYKALFQRSVGEEPLRFLARVAADDLAWTESLTADWSMGNDKLLTHFPMTEIQGGRVSSGDWRPVRYSDGRPAAGVLATNGLWWRYTSTADNRNRGRAAALSRILLCDHRYEAPVDFTSGDPSLPAGERLVSDPACVGCHATIDPLASTLYGFWRTHPESYTEALRYYPSREQDWQRYTGVEPGYYGQEAPSLWHVSRAVVADPRFLTCAVDTTWSFYLGRTATLGETDRASADREAFLDGSLRYRSLVRAVLGNPYYRSDDPTHTGTTGPKRLGPDQLAAAVEALTGYRWTVEGGIDAVVNDDHGFRILAGGVDGILVTEAPETDSATIRLVHQRLAEAAASYAVAAEASLDPSARTLLTELPNLSESPTDERARAQLRALVRRIHTRSPGTDSEDITRLLTLYRALEEDSSPQEAWSGCIAALLQHPDFGSY
jgi:hypothetical protein